MSKPEDCTIIILAGGRSSRMGTDKGLMVFNGKRMVEYVLEAARSTGAGIAIITENPAYAQFGVSCIPDQQPGKGPLGGIYTGLTTSTSSKILVLGCDMPFLTQRLLQELLNLGGEEDVLLTEHQRMAEPLCSVYDRRCAVQIRAQLDKNQLKITDALAGLKTRTISFDKEEWFRGNEFTNFNSPEELKNFLK